jgi:hypothetical protein
MYKPVKHEDPLKNLMYYAAKFAYDRSGPMKRNYDLVLTDDGKIHLSNKEHL